MKNSKEKEDFPTQVGQKRFSQWKKTALSKADLSRKGSIDEPLVEWVNLGMFKIIPPQRALQSNHKKLKSFSKVSVHVQYHWDNSAL